MVVEGVDKQLENKYDNTKYILGGLQNDGYKMICIILRVGAFEVCVCVCVCVWMRGKKWAKCSHGMGCVGRNGRNVPMVCGCVGRNGRNVPMVCGRASNCVCYAFDSRKNYLEVIGKPDAGLIFLSS